MGINSKSEEIFDILRTHITRKSKYNPSVLKTVVDNKYPLVVFETNANRLDSITQDMYRLNQVRSLSFEISIFAIDDKQTNSNVICDELCDLVCDCWMENYMLFLQIKMLFTMV